MKEIELNNKNYLLVEVPDDVKYIIFNHTHDWKSKHLVFVSQEENCYSSNFIDAKIKTEIIGKLSDILKDEDIC